MHKKLHAQRGETLLGGNVADSVVRLGATVRKPATRATYSVHVLLDYLHRVQFDGAPQAFGVDDLGRQILEFVPGTVWDRKRQNNREELRRVGALIRSLHDATASFIAPNFTEWDALSLPDGQDLVCHNDLAPWNLICGSDKWAFVDWDNAAPGTRLWDLAWAAISFPPVEPDCDLERAAKAIRAITDGYRLPAIEYERLLQLMVRRARAAYELLVDGAKTGRLPWARLHSEGHDKYWGPVSEYIERNLAFLSERMLATVDGESREAE